MERPMESKEEALQLAVSKIEAFIKIQSTNNAGAVSVALANVWVKHGFDMPAAQRELRRVGSRVFLVAAPSENFPGLKSGRMGTSEEYPYALWVCMNGEAEFHNMLRKIRVNEEQNERNLEHTGLLMQ